MNMEIIGARYMDNIKVIDNLLPTSHADDIHDMVLKSYYQISWEDNNELKTRQFPNLHSRFSFDDVKRTKILEPILRTNNGLKLDQYSSCVVNLTKPMDINFIHTHTKQKVFLYYVNPTWENDWGGETIFYEQDKKSVLFTSLYMPNRLVCFDGEIPHTIKAQNYLGPSYRFTMSIFFNTK